MCVPPSHWYLDESCRTVTRALLRKAYDVIEVPSLQAADEAPRHGPGQSPRLFGRERNHAKEASVKNADRRREKQTDDPPERTSCIPFFFSTSLSPSLSF